ncbi:MAG: HAMP domain-containing sensor histidine kinase [Chitinophagales bacterium]|nr:HAMP domain-containing sensor histidine kinase [Chitinophagales bacterium]
MKKKRQSSTGKIVLPVIALGIVLASVWYSNDLARDLAVREKKEAELWASAYRNIILSGEDENLSFEFDVISENESVPVILTDEEGKVLKVRNIDSTKAQNPEYIEERLKDMKSNNEPIEIEFGQGMKNFIYYGESNFITRLRVFPLIQLGIISAFLLFAYVLFSTARASEQNQLWVGMAKETAHQLGTPISSLSAWLEILKEKKHDAETNEALDEIQKDIDRLELVADRFSKIGSAPELKEEDLKPLLEKSLDYIGKRSSELVKLELRTEENVTAQLNVPLFEWVIENLLKNALDAMGGKGSITIFVSNNVEEVAIDVKDSGKGIPKSDFKTVFEPGFSTKKRGWGLGLTLSKRIIEQYHNGKIFVKESSPETGTTFRILLRK